MKQIKQVEEFHEKFFIPIADSTDELQDKRFDLIHAEVMEYGEAASEEEIAKELMDIIYTVLGAVVEHGLQDKFEKLFDEVHKSNMSKDIGEYKAIKGASYVKADIKSILKEKFKQFPCPNLNSHDDHYGLCATCMGHGVILVSFEDEVDLTASIVEIPPNENCYILGEKDE